MMIDLDVTMGLFTLDQLTASAAGGIHGGCGVPSKKMRGFAVGDSQQPGLDRCFLWQRWRDFSLGPFRIW